MFADFAVSFFCPTRPYNGNKHNPSAGGIKRILARIPRDLGGRPGEEFRGESVASASADRLHHREDSGPDGLGQAGPSREDGGEVGGGEGEFRCESAKKRAKPVS